MPSLFDVLGNPPSEIAPDVRFDGQTFEREHDQQRLRGLTGRVLALMQDGRWRTLREIVAVTGGSEASVSARLRDFRKERFGSHTVERRRRGEPKAGLFEYRVREP